MKPCREKKSVYNKNTTYTMTSQLHQNGKNPHAKKKKKKKEKKKGNDDQ